MGRKGRAFGVFRHPQRSAPALSGRNEKRCAKILIFLLCPQSEAAHFMTFTAAHWILEDAKVQFPEVYKAWREDPANFYIEGVYPVVDLWGRARKAWEDILSAKVGT